MAGRSEADGRRARTSSVGSGARKAAKRPERGSHSRGRGATMDFAEAAGE